MTNRRNREHFITSCFNIFYFFILNITIIIIIIIIIITNTYRLQKKLIWRLHLAEYSYFNLTPDRQHSKTLILSAAYFNTIGEHRS